MIVKLSTESSHMKVSIFWKHHLIADYKQSGCQLRQYLIIWRPLPDKRYATVLDTNFS